MEDIILSNPKPIKQEKRNEFLLGLNPDGTKIGTYRDFFYAKSKNNMNSLAGFGNVDLIVSGRFANSLYPERIGVDRYTFRNTIDYGNELLSKYGDGILGLNQGRFRRVELKEYAPKLRRYTISLVKR